MKGEQLKDNLKFEDNTEGIIFNHYSFCELIKHIMVKYGGILYQEADQKVKNSFLCNVPESSDDISFFSHDLEFHWAMLVLHGNLYWLKGIPSDYNGFKQEYLTWEAKIKTEYSLKESYNYYDL
ncbi:MAG: hypothetical protein HRT68_02030 [Flavobacteriaceae bacterium]|nr:hypothetical protein [Flavobacteriaceae bacterium]